MTILYIGIAVNLVAMGLAIVVLGMIIQERVRERKRSREACHDNYKPLTIDQLPTHPQIPQRRTK
jgi:ABC-type uncharacterized transport system permease subunit